MTFTRNLVQNLGLSKSSLPEFRSEKEWQNQMEPVCMWNPGKVDTAMGTKGKVTLSVFHCLWTTWIFIGQTKAHLTNNSGHETHWKMKNVFTRQNTFSLGNVDFDWAKAKQISVRKRDCAKTEWIWQKMYSDEKSEMMRRKTGAKSKLVLEQHQMRPNSWKNSTVNQTHEWTTDAKIPIVCGDGVDTARWKCTENAEWIFPQWVDSNCPLNMPADERKRNSTILPKELSFWHSESAPLISWVWTLSHFHLHEHSNPEALFFCEVGLKWPFAIFEFC